MSITTDTEPTVEETVTVVDAAVDATPADAGATTGLVVDELLVEEVSIDGMCGVY